MSTYAYSQIAAPRALGRDAVLPGAIASLAYFWLPVALIGFAAYCAEHSFHYATPGFSVYDNVDLFLEMGSSNLLRQLSFAALGAFGVLLLVRRGEGTTWVLDRPLVVLLAAVCAWTVLSAVWSTDILHSIKRSLQPLLVVLAALGVAKHWQPRQVCLAVALLTASFALLGIAAECANGTFLNRVDYRFSGTLHPNSQAINCAALTLASWALYCDARISGMRRRGVLWLGLCVIGLTLLVLTGARTATIALILALFTFYMLGASRLKKLIVAGLLLQVVAIVGLMLMDAESGTRDWTLGVLSMGRDQDASDVTSLTGRIPIWAAVLEDIAASPLVGYGYGDFWTPQRVLRYSYIHNWEFAHAHSAYFETLLNVGAIGLLAGLVLLGRGTWSAMGAFRASGDTGYRFIVAALVMALIHGFVDSNFVVVGFAPMLVLLCLSMLVWHGRQAAKT